MIKVDIATNISREWFDQGKADVIVDTLNSGVALAVSQIVKEKNKVLLNSGAASSDLTGKACSPNTIAWTYDTYALANGTGLAVPTLVNSGASHTITFNSTPTSIGAGPVL